MRSAGRVRRQLTSGEFPLPSYGAARARLVATFRSRLVAVYLAVAVLNIGGWLWAILAFDGNSVLLGIATLIYGLGLRHGLDADHIAAIDNVTRKLMHEGQRPTAVGFFFALGHSWLVVIVTLLVATATASLGQFETFRSMGGAIGTSLSATFLLLIAAINIAVFLSVLKAYRSMRAGRHVTADLDRSLVSGGLLARLFRPLFALISKSWHMVPLGVLFGLSFETATEIAIFSLSATQAARGLPIEVIAVLPILFAAGMTLIDTTDGVLMVGAYQWAFLEPLRKLQYNLSITLISIFVALAIAVTQLVSLAAQGQYISGRFGDAAGTITEHFNVIGVAIVGLFILAWALSWIVDRLRNSRAHGMSADRS